MMNGTVWCRRLLLVEDDQTILETLESLLIDEGYDVTTATSLEQAQALVEEQVFDFVLTDLFASSYQEPLASAAWLESIARPTPVGVMTAWPSAEEAAQKLGLAFLIHKPFELDAILNAINSSAHLSLSADQQGQAQAVNQYFSGLSLHAWEQVRSLCSDDFTFYPPANTPFATAEPIRGRDAYLAFAEQAQACLPSFRFDAFATYAHPEGLAARYGESWLTTDGTRHSTTGAVVCTFRGEQLSQVRVEVQTQQQLQRLLETTPTYQADRCLGH